MSNSIIKVENLSKSYILKHQNTARYEALRDVIANKAKSILNPKSQILNPKSEEFMALNDISFEVNQGDRVGIIGRNGAGKSTLLKILSRIVTPTKGRIIIDGRVSSLLEVGTGFHPELTGRENIFLNGSILGMNKKEIQKKFDEIVAFAEVENFLDTPVKRYSSGMYVRLAFAVAANLEPDILIVDEVLAVGDAEFQNKCLGKMKDVAGEGRTVIFVSHNIRAIRQLCDKIILLNSGIIVPTTDKEDAIAKYSPVIKNAKTSLKFPVKKETLIVHDFSVQQDNTVPFEYLGDVPIIIKIDYELVQDTRDFRIGFYIKSSSGELVARTFLADWQQEYANQKKGLYQLQGKIPTKFLPQGKYTIELKAGICGVIDYEIEVSLFHQINILNPLDYNNAYPNERFEGAVLLNPNWTVKYM